MFAVLSFGGFLGVGEKYYPVPWSSLDENQNSYVVEGAAARCPSRFGGRVDPERWTQLS